MAVFGDIPVSVDVRGKFFDEIRALFSLMYSIIFAYSYY